MDLLVIIKGFFLRKIICMPISPEFGNVIVSIQIQSGYQNSTILYEKNIKINLALLRLHIAVEVRFDILLQIYMAKSLFLLFHAEMFKFYQISIKMANLLSIYPVMVKDLISVSFCIFHSCRLKSNLVSQSFAIFLSLQ